MINFYKSGSPFSTHHILDVKIYPNSNRQLKIKFLRLEFGKPHQKIHFVDNLM